ncbi:MAG: hypothetical protein M0P66_01190 [Salinivirgaceae bacterium]|nr:hypothetical protein [Salinivirgaceae bacterium]
MKHVCKFGLLLAVLIIISSCNNQSSQKKEADKLDDVLVEETAALMNKYPMPTSYEIIQFLNETGAGYIYDITNPPANVENYLSYKQKAINLGIYAADLIYTTTYQKKDATANYLDNFVQLVGDLEISNLNREFFQRVQANLDNKDSLLLIIKSAQYDTHKFLEQTNKNELALYALSGSWIESIYLLGATVNFAENKEPLYAEILANKQSLIDLIKLMEPYKDKEDFKELYKSLKEIADLFQTLEVKDTAKIEALKDKVIALRNSLI